MFHQRRQNQPRQQNANRTYRRHQRYQRYHQRHVRLINNQDTLNRITNLLPQQIVGNPLLDQFFNGSPFY